MDHGLDGLIEHAHWLDASMTLSEAHDFFIRHACDFMAVLRNGEFVGLCSRLDVGLILGSRYGFSLNGSKKVTSLLRLSATQLVSDAELQDAFERVFSRELEYFYDDVVLLSRKGEYLGLIRTHTLIRLQNHFHRESISLLRKQSKEISDRNDRMLSDLELCWEMQRTLFPSRYPSVSAGSAHTLSVGHYYQPHAVVGGDFFHWRELSESLVGIFVADVMGHNLRSALITTMVRALFDEHASSDLAPDQVLTAMNQSLVSIMSDDSGEVVYVTACYLTIDVRDFRLQWASAGHPMPLLISADSEVVRGGFLDACHRGTVLGIFGGAQFSTGTAFLKPQDRVLLYTDGIYEITNSEGEDWGDQALLAKAVSCDTELSDTEFLDAVVEEAVHFCGKSAFLDDVCLVSIQCKASIESGGDAFVS